MANDESRNCPYCGVLLHHPYWQHIQSKHSGEYSKNETWIQLYKDYCSMGMSHDMSVMVIAELFNQSNADVEAYLRESKVI